MLTLDNGYVKLSSMKKMNITLRELLKPRMQSERYRPADIAQALNKSRQTVSLTLNRDLDKVRIGTFRQYLTATGLSFDPKNLISTQ